MGEEEEEEEEEVEVVVVVALECEYAGGRGTMVAEGSLQNGDR
jgi:hypothetical protein